MEQNNENQIDTQSTNASSLNAIKERQNTVAINTTDEAEELDFVSPDQSIFKQIAENVNRTERESYTATWHGTENENTGDFEMDEQYASTSQTNRHFMEAFGLNQTGAHKNTDDEDSVGEDTDETPEEYEYTDRMQRKEVIGMYRYARKSMRIRLGISVVFALLLLFVENITVFFPDPYQTWEYLSINHHPYLHIIVNFVLLVACSACAYEQLYHGTRSIFKRDLIPESVATIALFIGALNTITQLIFVLTGISPKEDSTILLFNFPVAFVIVSTIMFSYINIVREKYGFSVVSSKDSKFVLEKVYENNAEAEYDTFTSTSNGEFNGEIARIGKTAFVKNYFANTNAPVNLGKFVEIYYIIVLAIPVIFAIVSACLSLDASLSVTYLAAGVLLLLPIGTLFSYSMPFLIANKNLYEDEVAIIGEEGIEEFSNIDVIAVNDTTAFPPSNVKLTNFNVYNDFDMEKVLYYATSGFSVVGGPLAEVFEAATNSAVPKSKKVKFICSGRSYFCVRVDNDNIIFADKFGMTAQGIEVGIEREDKDDACVMYIACNGVLCSKMYIKYRLDSDFMETCERLNSAGMVIGIRTFDPNISNDLIKKLTHVEKKKVRVIKLSSINDSPVQSARVDAKIVSKGRSCALLEAIPACKKIVSIRKVIKAIKIISSLVGATYLGFSVFSAFGITLLPSIVVALFYALFLLIMLLVTLAFLPKRR